MSDHERLARNAQSKAHAEHDGEPWDHEETAFLMEQFPDVVGDPEGEEALAELMGRTIEACRQHYYVVRRGEHTCVFTRTETRTVTTTRYIGKHDDPDDQWWSPDYYK